MASSPKSESFMRTAMAWPARGLAFEKYDALGNDFVVVDAPSSEAFSSASAASICDRHRGVGADGVLVVSPPRDSRFAGRMTVVNSDGSHAEMCGNGLRCVVLHLASRLGLASGIVVVETGHGPLACEFSRDARDPDGGRVVVDMGVVRVTGTASLDVGGEIVEVGLADAGNPHAILFGAFDDARIRAIGPRISTHPSFAAGTNAEFARVSKSGIDLVVWERGAGLTLACGTGACATVALAVERGLVAVDTPVEVRLPGGLLEVALRSSDNHAIMAGPARRVFSGSF